jgi:hypothetical protein
MMQAYPDGGLAVQSAQYPQLSPKQLAMGQMFIDMPPQLSEAERQYLSTASLRRASRGSNSHRPSNALRVLKPASANNSPRAAMLSQRRRTMMNDPGFLRQHLPQLDQSYLPTTVAPDMFGQPSAYRPTPQAARPVSWHPSTIISNGQATTATAQYSFPAFDESAILSGYQQLPPTPAPYSGYTSPAFSPVSLPYSGFEAPAYFPSSNWAASNGTAPSTVPSPSIEYPVYPERTEALPPKTEMATSGSSAEWEAFVAHGFNTFNTPPTPDILPTEVKAEPKVSTNEPDSLLEEEPEGEVLTGMGLYDPPRKDVTDPTLETFRNSVAHLLGSAYTPPEPTGMGLMLEQPWEEPEKSDEDEEDDDDADAEGDNDEDSE